MRYRVGRLARGKRLHAEMEGATETVCKRRGATLVLADAEPDCPTCLAAVIRWAAERIS